MYLLPKTPKTATHRMLETVSIRPIYLRTEHNWHVQKTPVPPKAQIAFQFGEGVNDGRDSGQSPHDNGIAPIVVGMAVVVMIAFDALSVETDDGKGKDELKEAERQIQDDKREWSGGAAGRRGGSSIEALERHFGREV